LQSVAFRGLLAGVWTRVFSVALAALSFGCKQPAESSAVVELKVGGAREQPTNFRARTSLAQYVEIPGQGNELRLTIASYDASCDVFTPPPSSDDVSVSIVITTPSGVAPASGTYPWLGHEAHGGERTSPAKAYSFPTARIGNKSHVFQPGGGVLLKGLSLGKHGSVSGLLNFEFSGDAEKPATSLKGRFSARICRYSSADSS
jgi:hypothetical protein